MRIHRPLSRRVSPRRRPNASGCLSFLLVLGIMGGLGVLLWDRLMPSQPRTHQDVGLRATMHTAFNQGDLDTSIQASRALLALNGDDWQAHAMLIRSLIYRSYVDQAYIGDRAEALRLSQQMLERQHNGLAWQAIHAYALFANGQATEARQLALMVIERNPDDVPARLALSGAYRGQGIFEAALRDGTKAVELANRGIEHTGGIDWRVDALRAVAIAFSDLGRYDEARQTIERALNINRRLIPVHFEAALFAQQVGDLDSATASYFNIVAYDERNAKARLRLCEVSSRLGETVAVDYCRQATQNAPTWIEAWYQLGRETYRRGDFRGALEAMSRCTALQIMQEVPVSQLQLDCWYIQGQAAEVLGDCDALMRAYTQFQAMRAEANLPQVWTYPPEGPAICLDDDFYPEDFETIADEG